MDRASLNQELVREAVSSLVKPTNRQMNLRNQKVSVNKIKRTIRICETGAWNAIAEDFLHFVRCRLFRKQYSPTAPEKQEQNRNQ